MSHAVIAFGRMNPPTTGHEKMIHAVHKEAKRVGGHAEVIASHSQDKKKNPVPQDKKMGYLKKVAPKGVKVTAASKEHPTVFHHAARLHAAGHEHLTVMSDKSESWGKALKANNGKKGPHGHYNFKSITMKSSGKRDPKASGTEGISGTKMRAHAKSGDHKSFKAGLPKALHPHADEIMKHINEELQEIVNLKPSPFQQRAFSRKDPKEQPKTKRKKMQDKLHGAALDRKLGIMKRPSRNDEAADPEMVQKSTVMKVRNLTKSKAPVSRITQGVDQLAKGEIVRQPMVRNAVLGIAKNVQNIMQDPVQANRFVQMVRKNQKAKPVKPKVEEAMEIDEAMDIKQRIKRKLIMRRIRPKLKRMKKLYSKRRVPEKNIRQRARKAAIRRVRVKTTGARGASYRTLSPAAKQFIDKTVKKRQGMVDKIARRLLPKHRKAEIQRLSNSFDQFVGAQLNEEASPKRKDGKAFAIKDTGTVAGNTKHKYKEKTSKKINAAPVTEQDLTALFQKSEVSGFPFEVILEVFIRGIESKHLEEQTVVQNGFARVNSFINQGKAFEEDYDLVEGEYKKPEVQALKRKQKRKSDDFRSKQSVSSKTAAMFKKRHGGKTSQLRPGTKRTMGRSSSAKSDASVTMRPVGGVTKAHRDLGKYTEHDFRRIHGISKSAMRTKLRREEFDMFAEAIGQKKAMDDDVFKNVYNKRRAPSIPKGTGEKDTPFTGTIKSKKDIKEKTLTPEKVQDDSQNLTPNYSKVMADLDSVKQKPKKTKAPVTEKYKSGPAPTIGQKKAMDKAIDHLVKNPKEVPKFARSTLRGVPTKKKVEENAMDDAHAQIYPKKQAIKWKVKPPAGTKNIHPDSPYLKKKKKVDEKYSGPIITSINRPSVEKAAADSLKGKDKIYNQPTKAVPKRKDELMPPSEKRMRRQGYTKEDTNLSFSQWLEAYGSSYGNVRAGNPGGKSSTTYQGSKDYTKVKADPKKKSDRFGRAKTAVSWTKEDIGEENLDELSRETLGSYQSKASDARGHRKLSTKKVDNRYTGVARAADKLDKKNQEAVKEGVVGRAVLGGALGAMTGGPVGAAIGAASGAAHGIHSKIRKRKREKALDKLVKKQEAEKKAEKNDTQNEGLVKSLVMQQREKSLDKLAKKQDAEKKAEEAAKKAEKNDTQNEGMAAGAVGGAISKSVGGDFMTGYEVGSKIGDHLGKHAGKYAAGAAGLYAAKKIRDKMKQRRRDKAVDKLVKDQDAAKKDKKKVEEAAPLPTKKQSDTMAKIKQRIVTKKIKQAVKQEAVVQNTDDKAPHMENVPVEYDTNIIAAAANKGTKKKTNKEYVLKIGEKKDVPSNPYMKLEGTPEAAAHARKVTPGQVNEVTVDLEHPSGKKKTTLGKLVQHNKNQGWEVSKKQSSKEGQQFADTYHGNQKENYTMNSGGGATTSPAPSQKVKVFNMPKVKTNTKMKSKNGEEEKKIDD